MKRYLSIGFIIVGLISCGEPNPTELLEDTNKVQIEVVSKQPNLFVYSNGYDTTGISEPFIDKSTIISVSGIRNTNYGLRSKDEFYFAQFNDKTKPVYVSSKLLGYKTKSMGNVSFNNVQARVQQQMMGFHFQNMRKDTTLGPKYVVVAQMMGQTDFPYNSSVNFKLNTGNKNIQLDISTPPEIIGDVKTFGNVQNKNLQIELYWNGVGTGQVEIVIGTLVSYGTETFPLLKLVGPDNGKMKIPPSVLESIPLNQNKFLVFTFIRRLQKEIPINETLNDSYIIAQSIHNIKIQIPQ